MIRALAIAVAVALTACGGRAALPAFELVESFPIETSLDHPDIRDAHRVWVELIDGARTSLDIAEFYASNQAGSRLEAVVRAVERAAARGVRVRFLADAGFVDTYPETLARLAGRRGIAVRHYRGKDLAGGILHAKYFVVDGAVAFLGSQNFDWRSLTHIQELGLVARDAGVVRALADTFATDWALAGGARRDFRVRPPRGGYRFGRGVTAALSPRGWLPVEALWDLPQLVALIDGAERSVHVQLLSYHDDVPELEEALRRAGERGVKVRLLVADWSKRAGRIEVVQALERLPGVDVAMMVIPPASSGFIPFARVSHAKYLVADGRRLWLGTSNWGRDYFHDSRNVGVVIDDARLAGRVDRYFETAWTSRYAERVDPAATYQPPRVE